MSIMQRIWDLYFLCLTILNTVTMLSILWVNQRHLGNFIRCKNYFQLLNYFTYLLTSTKFSVQFHNVSPNFHWQKSLSTISLNLTRKFRVAKCENFPASFTEQVFYQPCQWNWLGQTRWSNKMVDCMCDKLHWQGEWWGTFISSQHLHATSTCRCEANISQAKPS